MIYFGSRLKCLRKQDGLTQQQLADKLGIKKSTISMYENGKREPDFETLESIADFFNVDMNTLTGRGGTCTFPSHINPDKKNSPGTDESAPRDEQEKSVMNLVSELTADQQEFLLAWLKTTIELRTCIHKWKK